MLPGGRSSLRSLPLAAIALVCLTVLAPAPALAATATAARTVQPSGPAPLPAGTYYFPWYDNASPGMTNDNIHVAATTASVSATVQLGSQTLTAAISAGSQHIFTFAPGSIGGPVTVTTTGGAAAIAQRVTYFRSFNEIAALAAPGGQDFWFPWFDNASPGMLNDNFHVVDPGGAPVTVTATLLSTGASLVRSVTAAEDMFSFPAGTIGGPVEITATAPILVSQRVEFGHSFNEVAGIPTPAAGGDSVFFNWYDDLSPGFGADNIHIVNTDASASATVTLNFTGRAPVTLPALGPRAETVYSYPASIGGAITVVSTGASVIATQRYIYYDAFKEIPAFTAADATTDGWFAWYDNASPCMLADNIHVLGVGAGGATGTITLGADSISFAVAQGEEKIYGFAAGHIGGPVHIQSTTGSFIAEQRVVVCPPPPPPPPPVVRRIVVSLSAQHLWAYQDGRLVMDTDVTTGRPELPTPPGDYHIFYRASPYEMISPWPYGSPYYYPPTWVEYVLEFREGGYFLHDAPWRTWFGPGSEYYGDGTHGCINLPGGAGWGPMYFLWTWAQIGDEVLVQD